MMKWKKILLGAALFVGVGSIFLTGCSSSKSESGSKTESKADDDSGKVLKIGTEGTYKPFSYHNEKDELVGFDVEVGRAIAQKLGMQAQFMEVNWEGLLAAMDNKQIDIVMNQVGISDERKQKYLFSEPYLYSYPALIVKKDNTELTDFAKIKGHKVASNVTTNFGKIANEFGAEIVPADTFSTDIELLLSGRVDLIINDTVAFNDYMKQKPDTPIKIAATLNRPSIVAIPLRKDETELQKKINGALDELKKDGTLKKISEKYFGEDLTVEKK